MQNKKVLIALITLMSLATVFILVKKLYLDQKSEDTLAMVSAQENLLVREHSPRFGDPGAKVTVVEFLDPECESCREFYPHTKMILEEYKGKVQLILRYAPFHPNSRMMVKILEASKKQNRYQETLETMFRTQPEWGSHHHPQPELVWKYLESAGINVTEIRAEMSDPAIERIIESDVSDGQALGVRGTPTFFVNGVQPAEFGPEALRRSIDIALQNSLE